MELQKTLCLEPIKQQPRKKFYQMCPQNFQVFKCTTVTLLPYYPHKNITEPDSKYGKTVCLNNSTNQTKDQLLYSVAPTKAQRCEKQNSTTQMQHYSLTKDASFFPHYNGNTTSPN